LLGKDPGADRRGHADNLLTRPADACRKERGRLVLLVREAPRHRVQLRNRESVRQMDGIILPPSPIFYHRPASIEQMADQCLARALALPQIEYSLAPRWASV